MWDGDYCVGYGGGAYSTKVNARAVFAASDHVASLSLRSSSNLTFPIAL